MSDSSLKEGRFLPPERQIDDDVLLNEAQAAERLAVQPNTLTCWRHTGKGPAYVKVGRSVRYRKSALDRWLASRTVTHEG